MPRHPYRHLHLFADGRILWAPNLERLALTHSPQVAPGLGRLLALLEHGESPAPGSAEAVVANLLWEQGFLIEHEIAQPPYPDLSTADCEVTLLTDFAPFLWQRGPAPLQVYLLLSQGWAYAARAGRDPCIECFWARWRADLGEGEALVRLLELPRSWRWEPVLSPEAARTLVEEARERPGEAFLKGRWLEFLPRPGCSCPLPEKVRSTHWVGHPLALIQDCAPWPEPVRLPLWSARTGHTAALTGTRAFPSGAGCDPDPQRARGAALGEALERYAASHPKDLFWAPWTSSDRTLLPERYLAWQFNQPGFGIQRPPKNVPLPWVPVQRPARQQSTRALVGQVCLSRDPWPGPALGAELSHGLACGPTPEAALLAGLWELVERDATALFWCTRQARRDRLPEDLPLDGLEALALDLPSLAGRAVAAFLRDSQGRICAGAAAGPDPTRKALTEALHNLEFLERHPGTPSPASPTSFAEHLRTCWHRPQDFPWEELAALPAGEGGRADSPLDLLSALESRGFGVYVRDLTTRDVAATGHAVVRVLAPDLVELPLRHDSWPLGLARFRRQTGGRAPSAPHPFG